MPAPSRVVVFFDHPNAPAAAEAFAATVGKLGMGWRAVVSAADVPDARFRVAFAPVPGVEAEVWPADPGAIAAEVADLVARLFTGAARGTTPKPIPLPPAPPQPATKPAKQHTVKVGRETKGRRGKGVTLVTDLPPGLGEAGVEELAATLKSRCGTGGTVKDRVIEIQGDQRDRVAGELERLGYKVKRAGG